MAEYLIQGKSLTTIADEIRTLSGTTDTMGLNAMATHVGNANTNVSTEANLIAQIATALGGKAIDSSFNAADYETNFEVKAYLTEELMLAASPRENTIGVITGNEITGWHFSMAQPTNMTEGEIWFDISQSSRVSFNALKKNSVMIYPLNAKQYISGALVNVIANIYQNGKWVDWSLYLYNYGDECGDITGGWESVYIYTEGYGNAGSLTKNSNNLQIKASSKSNIAVRTANKIDLTDYNTIKIKSQCVSNNYNSYVLHACVYSSGNYSAGTSGAAASKSLGYSTEVKEFSLDVSELSGFYEICFKLWAYTDVSLNYKVMEVILE